MYVWLEYKCIGLCKIRIYALTWTYIYTYEMILHAMNKNNKIKKFVNLHSYIEIDVIAFHTAVTSATIREIISHSFVLWMLPDVCCLGSSWKIPTTYSCSYFTMNTDTPHILTGTITIWMSTMNERTKKRTRKCMRHVCYCGRMMISIPNHSVEWKEMSKVRKKILLAFRLSFESDCSHLLWPTKNMRYVFLMFGMFNTSMSNKNEKKQKRCDCQAKKKTYCIQISPIFSHISFLLRQQHVLP